MKHPDSHELALFASNDLPPDARRTLAGHLRECEACAAEVAALDRTARRLANWQFPTVQSVRRTWAVPALRWAVAAALALWIGFSLGRFSAPRAADPAQLRADLERSLKATLESEWRRAVDEAQAESRRALAAVEERFGQAADGKSTQLARYLAAAVQSAREEDRASARVLVESLRREHGEELRRVRADLETVAANADEQLRFARFQLRLLTAANGDRTNQ